MADDAEMPDAEVEAETDGGFMELDTPDNSRLETYEK